MANALERVRLALLNCLAVKRRALFRRRLAPLMCKLVAQLPSQTFKVKICRPLVAQRPWRVCVLAKRRKHCKRPTTYGLTA